MPLNLLLQSRCVSCPLWISGRFWGLVFGLLTLSMVGQTYGQSSSPKTPQWIWAENATNDQKLSLRREFTVQGEVKQALLAVSVDNRCDVFVNGKKVGTSTEWEEMFVADVAMRLESGKNCIAIAAQNEGGVAGALVSLRIVGQDGSIQEVISDGEWRVAEMVRGNWRTEGFDDSKWAKAKVLGALGDPKLAWSGNLGADAITAAHNSGSGGEFVPVLADNVQAPEGFQVEKVYQVPRSMGSWVALTTDAKGRLIASDQGGSGLFLITPGNKNESTKVERLPVQLSGAQGLLWAFDSLYAFVNGGPQSGLHRLRDTNNDGLVDNDEFCMPVPGGGEHGPHAVVLSPDGKSIYVVAGNHTKLPEQVAGSRIPQNWGEDHLLPRRWDANGHAAGILAPGGWICQVDPSGKQWVVHSMGYRNQYDIAFNPDGELFTYDSDMEWDLGSPWYRPTRICHATSGSEFGWRSGTGTWPPYYQDSLPPSVEIGPGSPTGVVFGTGTKFPAKYQRALFILDWTYSTIYSVELTPDGASYRGKKSDFITGSPLPVTDAIVGQDGAMYFAAGGRGTQSSLYRVTYVGKESTAPVDGHDEQGKQDRAIRRQLEEFHGRSDGDVTFIAKHLDSPDRFIRYAARIALENQPVAKWREIALSQTKPQGVITAMMALARQGEKSDQDRIVSSLTKLDYKSLSEADKLAWLRAMQLVFTRLGEPSESTRTKLVTLLDGLYPAPTYFENAELVQLLVYLRSPTVITKTFAIIDTLGEEPIPDWGYLVARNANYGGTVGKLLANMPPVRAIHFAFVLRNVKTGWTMPQRQKYFEFFPVAAKHPGGNSYAKFLAQFRDDAIATCTPAEAVILAPLTSKSLLAAPVASTPPKGPGRKWTTSEALAEVGKDLKKRSYEQGRNLYHATSCAKCHRIGGEGGAIGPDLSTAGKKFSLPDLLDAITDPSKAISDQYGSHQVVLGDGKVLLGRAVEIGDEVYVYTADTEAKPVIVKKDDIESLTPSKISQMPAGLIDSLNPEELKDLIAYLLAAGDSRAKDYR